MGGVRMKKTVQVPHDGPGIVKRVAEVWARFVGRDDELDIPAGWEQFGVDGEGRPLFGYVGWSQSPRQDDLAALAEALRENLGK